MSWKLLSSPLPCLQMEYDSGPLCHGSRLRSPAA